MHGVVLVRRRRRLVSPVLTVLPTIEEGAPVKIGLRLSRVSSRI